MDGIIFCKRLIYRIFRIVFKNKEIPFPISTLKVRKILIFRYDVVGDMIVSFPAFELLRSSLPQAKIYVLASEKNYKLVQNFSAIDGYFVYPRNFLKRISLILRLRKEQFDLIINFVFYRTTKAGLIANLINRKAIKVNLGHETRGALYSALFNVQILPEYRGKYPMSEFLCRYICNLFGWEFKASSLEVYRLPIPENSVRKAKEFVQSIPYSKKLLINISAQRRWSCSNYSELIQLLTSRFPSLGLIFIGLPKDYKKIRLITANAKENVFVYPMSNDIFDVIALVREVDFVFTPDTSIVHIANAFRKPVAILYSFQSSYIEEWMPNLVPFEVLATNNHKNYDGISIDEVFNAIVKLIG
jgi:ADP-heptose:LPS heptosyltransferase